MRYDYAKIFGMTLEFAVDPELTESLQEEVLDCWTEVSQAGGAVGFVPPVSRAEVAPVAGEALARVASGQDRLIVGRIPGGDSGGSGSDADGAQGAASGRLAALAFIADDQFGLSLHWRMVKRVMIHPDFQGAGYGVGLMDAVAQVGRSMGLEMLSLDCRGGTGVELFYKKCGYLEWGRMPRALRVAPDDYREKICLYLSL
jgi:GNAT superfamily N-acetyltransferase